MAILLAVIAIITLVAAAVLVIIWCVCRRYECFVRAHNVAYKEIAAMGNRYSFAEIPPLCLENTYDNEKMYAGISTTDYLVYYLADHSDQMIRTINFVEKNAEIYSAYRDELKKALLFGRYDTEKLPRFNSLLAKKEWELINALIKHPTVEYKLQVRLLLKNMAGRLICKKSAFFQKDEVITLIGRLRQKKNGFYLDGEIWDAICHVERGKVSNRMRFAIYKRDGNRCRYCGSTYDLQVDHIYPIAKGGKSVFDNLQTLCGRCNQTKSDSLGNTTVNTKKTCPSCKSGTLVLRQGKYGAFYGCSNYPRCNYIKNKQ